MLHHALRVRIVFLLAIVLVVVAMSVSFLTMAMGLESHPAQAQDGSANMQMYLQDLKHTSETEEGFSFVFQFVEPLVADEELWVIEPPGANEHERYITQVGEDFVCFNDLAGAARFEICTPFTNIISVSHLVN